MARRPMRSCRRIRTPRTPRQRSPPWMFFARALLRGQPGHGRCFSRRRAMEKLSYITSITARRNRRQTEPPTGLRSSMFSIIWPDVIGNRTPDAGASGRYRDGGPHGHLLDKLREEYRSERKGAPCVAGVQYGRPACHVLLQPPERPSCAEHDANHGQFDAL